MLSLPLLARQRPVSSARFSASRSHLERLEHRVFPPVFALASVVIFSLAASSRADIHTAKQRGNIPRDIVSHAPATAIPTTGEIDPGGQIKFILEGRGAGTKTVDFDFSAQPQHGVLTDFHLLTRNTAEVTYVHNPDSGPGHDEFTYRVHANDLEMSAPAKVEVTIHEYPPRLAVNPAELDFGVVKTGQIARAMVSVRNDGGGLATGRLELPEPWVVDGDDVFRLAAGEKQTFKVIFRPNGGRGFSENVRVGDVTGSNQQNATLHLIGTGVGGPVEKQYAGINGVAPAPFEENTGSSVPASVRAATAARYPAGTPVGPVAGSSPQANTRSPGTAFSGTSFPAGSSVPGNGAGTDGSGGSGTQNGAGFEAPVVILNEAGVKKLEIRDYGRTYMDLTWNEPKPRPASYRIELRHLALDSDDQLLVTWLPHPKVELRVKDGVVNASLRNLPAGTNQAVRVVAVDSGGHLAAPSPLVQAKLDDPVRWWRLSLLQWLLVACAVCVGFVVRQRIQDRQIIAQIDADRAQRREAEAAMSVFGR